MSGPAEAISALIDELLYDTHELGHGEIDDFVELIQEEVYDGVEPIDLEGGE